MKEILYFILSLIIYIILSWETRKTEKMRLRAQTLATKGEKVLGWIMMNAYSVCLLVCFLYAIPSSSEDDDMSQRGKEIAIFYAICTIIIEGFIYVFCLLIKGNSKNILSSAVLYSKQNSYYMECARIGGPMLYVICVISG